MKASIKNMLLKNAFALVTVVCGLITAWVLFYIQYHTFGGAIETLWFYAAIMFVMIGFGEQKDESEDGDGQTAKKAKKPLTVALSIALGCLVVFFIIKSPYNAVTWNVVMFAAVLYILSLCTKFKKAFKDRKNVKIRCLFMVAVCVLLMLEPLAFAGITGAHTVKEVEKLLTEQKYESAVCVENVKSTEQLSVLFEDVPLSVNDGDMDMGAYVFTAAKDDKKVAAAVSVKTGKLLAASELKPASILDCFVSDFSNSFEKLLIDFAR